jgi:hypothetical protein
MRFAAAFVILILSRFSGFAAVYHSDGARRCGYLIDRRPGLADEEMGLL